MSPQAKPFLPVSQQSAFGPPPPLPPKHYEVNDSEMDYFCERVTAHVIDGELCHFRVRMEPIIIRGVSVLILRYNHTLSFSLLQTAVTTEVYEE